ncbi:MAG TPA: zf-HC2 domain-containing protein [Gaiellaceae bacterium]|jgi:predicted anti-sigma-YlaC factor YlaD|nr:zf-HC2 domain-containing protein [Gaiellaceae bacterium]
MTPVPSIECVQARESASVRLDAELPELDTLRLDAHLRSCAECRAFAEELAALTAELRTARLERPGTAVVLPRRSRLPALQMRPVAAVAALVVVAAGSSFALGHAVGTNGPAVPTVSTVSNVGDVRADSTLQHLLARLSSLQPEPRSPGRLKAV